MHIESVQMIKRISFESHWILDFSGSLKFNDGNDIIELSTSSIFYDGENDMNGLLELPGEKEIIDYVAELSGSWSLILYRADLNKIFVGRDIFGRQSLVFSGGGNTLLIGCAVHRNLSTEWEEVPFAQITCVDLVEKSSVLNYFIPNIEQEFIEKWTKATNVVNTIPHIGKLDLVEVNREVGTAACPEAVGFLFDTLISNCKRLKQGTTEHGVAFSGGVDSLLVAHALLHATSKDEIITLVNVAFGEDEKAFSSAPDRKRSIDAFVHLSESYPERELRLLLRNVTGEELKDKRESFISRAAAPCISVLDDSLACVVWFALEGKGTDFRTLHSGCTEASGFFVGSGADEIFAGYARHRNRFVKDGLHSSVAEECELELRRLGSRNGGRDSRVASHLKRHLIAPFLSDNIVRWANKLPVLAKCDLTLERGIGEKRIIRQALMKLNAPNTAPKQAMQFGSRIAKLTNESKQVKGSDISSYLQTID